MTRTALTCLLLTVIAPSLAKSELLDFNVFQVGEAPLGYYNGGTGSLGTGPGPAAGYTLTSGFITVADGVFTPPARAESLTTPTGALDIQQGFQGVFSFYYTNSGPTAMVNLFSGLDGGGTLLGNISLAPVTMFSPAASNFLPLFRSAVFTGTAGTLVFDNMTTAFSSVIPEPSPLSLLFLAMLLSFFAAGRTTLTSPGSGPLSRPAFPPAPPR